MGTLHITACPNEQNFFAFVIPRDLNGGIESCTTDNTLQESSTPKLKHSLQKILEERFQAKNNAS